jgi:hypothetical protein
MNRFRTLTLLLAATLAAAAEPEIAVLEALPAHYTRVAEVGASSRESAARTASAQKSYTIREMQRQAAALGANAIVVTGMQEWREPKPVYGRRPGSLQYEHIIHYQGSGIAITIDPALLPEADNGP